MSAGASTGEKASPKVCPGASSRPLARAALSAGSGKEGWATVRPQGHRHAAGGRCQGQPHEARHSEKIEPTHDVGACLAARACGRWGLSVHPSPRNSRSTITCVLVANSGKFCVRSAVLGILSRALHPRHIFALHAAGGLGQHTHRRPWNVCQRAHATRASVNGELVRTGTKRLPPAVVYRPDARA